jgi:hypothetical protein
VHYLLAVTTPSTLELVEDAVVLIQITKLSTQVLVDVDLLHRCLFITDVPDLECQVISGQDVVAVFREFDF